MKLVKPKAELLIQGSGLDGIYKQIEKCGRTCYRSEDKITKDSAKPFVDRMIKSNHLSMLEHGTVYLKAQSYVEDTNFWILANSPYAKVVDDDISNITYITTNLRAVIELFPTTWHGFLGTYMFSIEESKLTPQQARDVLPNATKTELIMTGFSSDWRHVMEEASETIYAYTDDLREAIEDAKYRTGKYLVIDNEGNGLFDTQPNVSYKI